MQQKTFFKRSEIPHNSKLDVQLNSMPLDPEIRRFLNYIQIHGLITRRKKGRMPSKRSLEGFEEQLRRFKVFTDKPWNEIAPEDIYGYADWLFEKGYSQRTIGHDLYTLQNMFNYLIETKRMGDASRKDNLGRYLDNPCVYVSKPTGKDFGTVIREMKLGEILDETKLLYFVEMLIALQHIFESTSTKEELVKKLADLLWK